MPDLTIRERLFALGDAAYADFTAKLTPNIPRERVIGVRTPVLRALAKELRGSEEAAVFLTQLPHVYFEENNLHGFLLESVRSFDDCIAAVERFLPYIDNWATCDQTSPRALIQEPQQLLSHVYVWLADAHPYTVRYGVETLMRHYLDARFSPEFPAAVAAIRSDEYYVNMMIAWYFATALAKQYDAVLPFLETRKLAPWTHNKAIRKAIESRRVSDARKAYLRTLQIK